MVEDRAGPCRPALGAQGPEEVPPLNCASSQLGVCCRAQSGCRVRGSGLPWLLPQSGRQAAGAGMWGVQRCLVGAGAWGRDQGD